MLKGLKGIFEKIVDVAVPVLGNMIGGPWGAALGGGVLAALKGKNTKDIITNAALSWGGAKAFGGGPQAMTSKTPKEANIFKRGLDWLAGAPREGEQGQSRWQPNIFNRIADFGGGKWGEAMATGLPAILGWLGAKEDEAKAGPDMSYESTVSDEYGGPLAPPPAEKRVGNMNFTGFDDEGNPQYGNFALGGEVAVEEIVDEMGGPDRVSYSAYTGLPSLAHGGRPVDKNFYKNIRTAEQGIKHLANGGNTRFPRRTGTIQGPGTKTSDSIPAMLSDGEFVQKTDAVNGAGIMMGARNAADAQKKGAQFMYALQDKLASMGNRVA